VKAITLEGHEDWVRCLSLTTYPSNSSSAAPDLMLASGAQDNYIRLWRISPAASIGSTANGDGLDILDEFEQQLAADAGGSVQLSTKAHVLSVEDGDRSV
jgi:elongator complex protein 2